MQTKRISLPSKLLLIVLFAGIYMLGYIHGHANLVFDKNLTPKLVHTELKKPTTVDFSIFWDVYNTIDKNYVTEPDKQKMVQGAIAGMVESLDDPFSLYLTKDQSQSFLKDLNGEFEGIGAELAIKSKMLTIMTLLPDSPASKAGLNPNDQIVAIEGKSTLDMSLSSAVDAIRGKRDTKVALTVATPGDIQTRDIIITRAALKAQSVTLTRRDDGVAILRIMQFGDDTSKRAQKYARDLAAQPPKGLILDLRGNPGGLLSSSIDIVSLFVSDKTVVIEKDRKGQKDELKTVGTPILPDTALVVLVYEASASASEIVAGALQDYGRAKLVGVKTYGKGSVQDFINLSDDSTVKLTIAQWLTPKGRAINHEGIVPDVEVKQDEKSDADEQQDKALLLILEDK